MAVLRLNKAAKSSETSKSMLSSRRDRPSRVAILGAAIVTMLMGAFVLSA